MDNRERSAEEGFHVSYKVLVIALMILAMVILSLLIARCPT